MRWCHPLAELAPKPARPAAASEASARVALTVSTSMRTVPAASPHRPRRGPTTCCSSARQCPNCPRRNVQS
ncbi:MAG TPA: hypothetical protein VHC70_04150 [Phycisphaerales bacterium]|nr:hypothetical protein [Phycisphaerales bacterium]